MTGLSGNQRSSKRKPYLAEVAEEITSHELADIET